MIETAPRVSQNNWGNWMTMYKRFGISMYYLQFQMAKQALSRAKTPEQRAEAKRQIVGLFASSALFAGVQGLPLYGIVSWLGNNVFLDDEDEDFDSIAASYFGEGMYSGALNAIFQVDVGPRIGMSNLIYRSQPNRAEQDITARHCGVCWRSSVRCRKACNKRWESYRRRGKYGRDQRQYSPLCFLTASKPYVTLRKELLHCVMTLLWKTLNAWNVFAQSLGLAPSGLHKAVRDQRPR